MTIGSLGASFCPMFNLDSRYKVLVTAEYRRDGELAIITGDPVWASSDPAVLSVEPVPGTLTAWLVSVAEGTSHVTATATPADGSGEVVAGGDVSVDEAGVITGTLVFGEPVLK